MTKPRHEVSCDEYHAHTKLGIKYNPDIRCCAPACPACRYEDMIEDKLENILGVKAIREGMHREPLSRLKNLFSDYCQSEPPSAEKWALLYDTIEDVLFFPPKKLSSKEEAYKNAFMSIEGFPNE